MIGRLAALACLGLHWHDLPRMRDDLLVRISRTNADLYRRWS